MSQGVNVVHMWRRRGAILTRNGEQCSACGAMFLVKRRACPACASTAGFATTPLPLRANVEALCSSGASVEHLDQVTSRKPSVFLNLDGVGRIACLVADVDGGKLDALRGQTLKLVVRKLALGHLPTSEPIPYGLKAAAELTTRRALRQPAAPAPEKAKETT